MKHTRLSVNINKIATLRNARGENMPDLVQVALRCQQYGAQGITVHPRPDQRHIRYNDVFDLRPAVTTEFNIEGYPSAGFIDLVTRVRPEQVTLVPDAPDALTSSAGWDVAAHVGKLTEIVAWLKEHGIRTSIFVNPDTRAVKWAARTGADRIELYTKPYADAYDLAFDMPSLVAEYALDTAIAPYVEAAKTAHSLGLGVNAGHDLNRLNLGAFVAAMPWLDEVSIGHALICDALLGQGLEKTIARYLDCLRPRG